MSDLTARIREAVEQRIAMMTHLPTCYYLTTGKARTCCCPARTVRLVVDAVLDLCDDEDHRLREQGYTTFVGAVSAADLRRAITVALGVPTESEPCAQHQGGGQ